MGTRINQITARRIAGDRYNCTSADTTLNEELSWDGVCRLARSGRTSVVNVVNTYAGPGELPEITYRPSADKPLSEMVRPSMATNPVIE